MDTDRTILKNELRRSKLSHQRTKAFGVVLRRIIKSHVDKIVTTDNYEKGTELEYKFKVEIHTYKDCLTDWKNILSIDIPTLVRSNKKFVEDNFTIRLCDLKRRKTKPEYLQHYNVPSMEFWAETLANQDRKWWYERLSKNPCDEERREYERTSERYEEMLYLLCDKLKFVYYNVGSADNVHDMMMEGYSILLKNWSKFDRTVSNNPFSFCTTTAKNGMLGYLKGRNSKMIACSYDNYLNTLETQQ